MSPRIQKGIFHKFIIFTSMSYKIPFSIEESEKLIQDKEYFFDEYNYYLNEREKIKEEIIFSLNHKTNSYLFKNWFRLVNTKYSHHPLNCKGSVKTPTGGRFNIGQIKEGCFSPFPALYIGNGKETCMKEVYRGMEDFLNSNIGDSFFPVSGHIHSVLDITKKSALDKFIKTIKQIKPSQSLQTRAKKLNIKKTPVQSIIQLKTAIYNINWKREPNIFDIPAPSQIFGQLAKNAGIEAILYKSTKRAKEGLCMAIFPENFKNSPSHIQLEDSSKNITDKKMDSKTFENFY